MHGVSPYKVLCIFFILKRWIIVPKAKNVFLRHGICSMKSKFDNVVITILTKQKLDGVSWSSFGILPVSRPQFLTLFLVTTLRHCGSGVPFVILAIAHSVQG